MADVDDNDAGSPEGMGSGGERAGREGAARRSGSGGSGRGGENVKRSAGSFASKAAQVAESYSERLGDNMREGAERLGREQRDRVEAYIDAIRAAIDAGSDHLEEGGFSTSARFVRMAAEQVDAIGERIEDADLSGYVRSVEDAIRSRPVITLGAAALLGFAVIQLMKSSDHSRRRRQG